MVTGCYHLCIASSMLNYELSMLYMQENSIVLITTDMDTSMCYIIDNFLGDVSYDYS
jgi:hypothetical protein